MSNKELSLDNWEDKFWENLSKEGQGFFIDEEDHGDEIDGFKIIEFIKLLLEEQRKRDREEFIADFKRTFIDREIVDIDKGISYNTAVYLEEKIKVKQIEKFLDKYLNDLTFGKLTGTRVSRIEGV